MYSTFILFANHLLMHDAEPFVRTATKSERSQNIPFKPGTVQYLKSVGRETQCICCGIDVRPSQDHRILRVQTVQIDLAKVKSGNMYF